MKDEYISREAVREMLENAQIISDGEYSGYCTEDVDIDAIPTAVVVPVVRGKWAQQELAPTRWRFCSRCGFANSRNSKWKFCPNCGADMRTGDRP